MDSRHRQHQGQARDPKQHPTPLTMNLWTHPIIFGILPLLTTRNSDAPDFTFASAVKYIVDIGTFVLHSVLALLTVTTMAWCGEGPNAPDPRRILHCCPGTPDVEQWTRHNHQILNVQTTSATDSCLVHRTLLGPRLLA